MEGLADTWFTLFKPLTYNYTEHNRFYLESKEFEPEPILLKLYSRIFSNASNSKLLRL